MNSRTDSMRILAMFLVLCGAACLKSCQASSQDEVLRYSPRNDDRGQVENCGSTIMNITWFPKVVDPHSSLTFEGSFVFPVDFDQGTLDTDVKIGGMEFGNTFSVNCAYLQKGIPTLTCPAKKNQAVKGSYTISDLSKLSGFSGPLEVLARVYNSNKEEVICGKIKTVIKA